MNQDRDNILVLRVENDEPQQVEVRRVQNYAHFKQAMTTQPPQAAMTAEQQAFYNTLLVAQQRAQQGPLSGMGGLLAGFGSPFGGY